MKITIVGPAHPLRGGIAHHVYWLRRDLERRGHTVQTISFRRLYPALLFPGRTMIDTSRLSLQAGGQPILDPLAPSTWRSAAREITAFQADAAVFEWWHPFFALLVRSLARRLRRSGVRCIAECHNVLPHERWPGDALLVRFALSSFDAYLSHCRSDRDRLLALLPGRRVAIAPLPVLEEFSTGAAGARTGRNLLFFGIVRKYKGLDVLLRAMPLVLREIDCRLVVAGEFYEPVAGFRRLAAELGVTEKIELRDRWVPNEEVGQVLAASDVLVLPYRTASQSGVVRLALANRLPVIASGVGGLAENVVDGVTGLVVPPGDPAALAAAIVSYFHNDLGPRFAANCGAACAESETGALGEVLEDLAARRS